MDLQTINEKYGTYIWKVANRYHTGIWSPEDVFNEVLLCIDLAIKLGKLGIDNSTDTIKLTKSVIISKAIDIVKRENIRKCVTLSQIKIDQDSGESVSFEPEASQSTQAVNFEIELIRELLLINLGESTTEFILELAFPSLLTVQIATDEQNVAKKDLALRMNIRSNVKIFPRHVAQCMLMRGKLPPCQTTMWRMRNEAKKVFPRLNIGRNKTGEKTVKLEIDNVVESILSNG